jgi:predicted nucleic-acid-binding protein
MIGLDTNVLVRYVTQDDPGQSRTANALIGRLSASEPGFVSVVVVAEIAWVLESVYRLSDLEVAAVIEQLLQADALVVDCEKEVYTALTVLRGGVGSFADALIAALGAKAGCSRTVTFDAKALRIPGFADIKSL